MRLVRLIATNYTSICSYREKLRTRYLKLLISEWFKFNWLICQVGIMQLSKCFMGSIYSFLYNAFSIPFSAYGQLSQRKSCLSTAFLGGLWLSWFPFPFIYVFLCFFRIGGKYSNSLFFWRFSNIFSLNT